MGFLRLSTIATLLGSLYVHTVAFRISPFATSVPSKIAPIKHNAFTFHTPSTVSTTTTTSLNMSDKQDEIAALEQRLKELKQENPTLQLEDDEIESTRTMDIALDEPDVIEGQSDESVMFSEKWKEAKDGYITKQTESNMGGLVKAGLALGAVVLLGFFSQIPVGEDNLQKYQDILKLTIEISIVMNSVTKV